MGFLDRYSAQMLGIVRIVAGLCFLEHGTSKFLNFPPGPMHPALLSMGGFGGAIELIGGALIVLGLFSRWAAFIASGEMAVGCFMVHFPRSFFPSQNQGDAAILFCFLFLYLAAAGPGAFAVNRK